MAAASSLRASLQRHRTSPPQPRHQIPFPRRILDHHDIRIRKARRLEPRGHGLRREQCAALTFSRVDPHELREEGSGEGVPVGFRRLRLSSDREAGDQAGGENPEAHAWDEGNPKDAHRSGWEPSGGTMWLRNASRSAGPARRAFGPGVFCKSSPHHTLSALGQRRSMDPPQAR